MTDSDEVPPPMPGVDDCSRAFWDGVANHQLVIQQCAECGKYQHPPRPVCRFCLSSGLKFAQVSGRATLYSWTILEHAPHPYFAGKTPYVLASVELAEQPGLRMLTNIVGYPHDQLRIGLSLEVVYGALTPKLTLPYFTVAP